MKDTTFTRDEQAALMQLWFDATTDDNVRSAIFKMWAQGWNDTPALSAPALTQRTTCLRTEVKPKMKALNG